ncbi:rRNA maturation RNase YbeY [Patescibacteria group bacterium]|nr:rRNA maturation RNase YbeY [Patescibacteria group bacterium]
MIEINNLTKTRIDQNFVKKIVSVVLKTEKKTKSNTLSIALVGTERMRKLNKKYRNKNQTTDILSFCEFSNDFFVKGLEQIENLGEIIICLREVKKNSQKINITFEKEFTRVLIHGILHLLGYDHEKSKKQAIIMQKKRIIT